MSAVLKNHVLAEIVAIISSMPGSDEFDAVQYGLKDEDPLIRIAALRTLRQFPAELRLQSGSDLLDDSVRGVRHGYGLLLIRVPVISRNELAGLEIA